MTKQHIDITCIQCGRTDLNTCSDSGTEQGCHWVRIDRSLHLGVCSACDESTSRRWDAGERTCYATNQSPQSSIVSYETALPVYIPSDTNTEGFLICPACQGTQFAAGPEASLNRNLMCQCGAQWNHGPSGFQPINESAIAVLQNWRDTRKR